MSKTEKQKIGEWGEEQAALFLIRQGYTIIDKNFTVYERGQKVGEVDIIAWSHKHYFGKTLCFVEVKTRSYGEGSAERATRGGRKMNSFISASRQYCLDNDIDLEHTPIQFEQVSVYIDKGNGKIKFKKYVIPIG